MVLLLAASFAISTAEAAVASGCDYRKQKCEPTYVVDASAGADGVTLQGRTNLPGTSNGGRSAGSNSGTSGTRRVGVPGQAVPAPTTPPIKGASRDYYSFSAAITVDDLVNFKPAPGTDQMEPDGWTVVGLETNFYARAGVQVQTGDLLGRPATVRFTPVRYRWDYGDGSTATRTTAGATWDTLGVSEFERTATSHIYRADGIYRIGLTVYFAAEYRYDLDYWVPVIGIVPAQANQLEVVTGTAKTVLVGRECTVSAAGPGC